MNNPASHAQKLLNELGWTNPGDITIEEMAWACGLVVKRREMDGCEGRIILNKEGGIICINAAIDYQPKINYILAHEIGHARMHRELAFFAENSMTLQEWYAKGYQEKEANEFAAELLMPAASFKKLVKGKKLNLQLIEQAATYFGASKTATFLRYRDLGDFPVMIVFIEKGVIKWRSHSHDFPFTWLPLHTAVPSWTVAGDYYYKGIEESRPAKVKAIEWFPEDRRIEGNENQELWEQCFPATRDSILTCIWTN